MRAHDELIERGLASLAIFFTAEIAA